MVSRLLKTLSIAGCQLLRGSRIQHQSIELIIRQGTHYRSGAVKSRPEQLPFGFLGVLCAVVPGLFLGAAISKSVANFLEENELFIPSDDDDDDED